MAKKSQIDKFKEAAREAEAADDEEAFNEALKSIAEAQKDPNEKFGLKPQKKADKKSN
jgi:hypothetical protein